MPNHAHKKVEDQGILSNRPVLAQNCTVKCLGGITRLKHDLTLIFFTGAFVHTQGFPPWPENKIMHTFDGVKIGCKTGLETVVNPIQQHGCIFSLPMGLLPPFLSGTRPKVSKRPMISCKKRMHGKEQPIASWLQKTLSLEGYWLAVKGLLAFRLKPMVLS